METRMRVLALITLLTLGFVAHAEDDDLPIAPQAMDGFGGAPQIPFAPENAVVSSEPATPVAPPVVAVEAPKATPAKAAQPQVKKVMAKVPPKKSAMKAASRQTMKGKRIPSQVIKRKIKPTKKKK